MRAISLLKVALPGVLTISQLVTLALMPKLVLVEVTPVSDPKSAVTLICARAGTMRQASEHIPIRTRFHLLEGCMLPLSLFWIERVQQAYGN